MINNGYAFVVPPQYWRRKYPAIISGILSFIQLVVTLIIIACEIGSVLIDRITATIYVGFWSSLFFLIACICQGISSCCCLNRDFATATLIAQIISMYFAFCVIGFDSLYIARPTTCFFPSSQCTSNGTDRGLYYSTNNFDNFKMTTIKVQLAAGCLMWLLCVICITIYIITVIRVYRAKHSTTIYPQVKPSNPVFHSVLSAPPVNSYVPPMSIPTTKQSSTVLTCPTCSVPMNMTMTRQTAV